MQTEIQLQYFDKLIRIMRSTYKKVCCASYRMITTLNISVSINNFRIIMYIKIPICIMPNAITFCQV